MTETMRRSGRQQAEVDLLWKEIRAAAENGDTLRDVFERMGRTLGRKPNSVRNYYFMQLRDQGGESLRRARQNPAETHDRLKVQRDLMSMRLEDLQSAVQDLIALCKDYLGETEETPAFREALAGRLARPESLAGS